MDDTERLSANTVIVSDVDSLEEPFASYCPHCHTGDPGDDYCNGCGEPIYG